MSLKTLAIVESAYRATLEEQDDTAIWFTAALASNAPFTVLLQGNAVNYAVAAQDARGLRVGDWRQTCPPVIQNDLANLIGKGVEVYAVEDDMQKRGIGTGELVPAIKLTPRTEVAQLVARHDRVWHW